MISELRLKNWKSYKDSKLYIDPLSVLIGVNSSGKSNALDALVLLNRLASGMLFNAAIQGDSINSPMRGGLEWAAMKPGNLFELGIVCRFDNNTDYEYTIECCITESSCDLHSESLQRIKYRTNKNGDRTTEAGKIWLIKTDACAHDSPTIVARLYNESKGAPRQCGRSQIILFQLVGQRIRQEIQEGVDAVLESLRSIFILDPIPSHMRGYSYLSDRLEPDAKNIAGVLAGLPPDRAYEIERILTDYATQLPERDIKRVYAERVGKFKSDAMLYCEEKWGLNDETHNIDARGMSDGTLRFLAIQTALLTRPKGSLLVVEEVDNGLHPSRSELLINMLQKTGKERGVDVLVTTHNPALLDAMGTQMVPFITVAYRNNATGYSELVSLDEIGTLPKLLAKGQVGNLSSKGLIEKALKNTQLQMDFDA